MSADTTAGVWTWRPLVMIVLGVAVLALLVGRQVRPASASLPEVMTVPPFSLTGQSAQRFDSRQLLGSVWIADFVFTNCAGPCPIMTARMNELEDRLADDERVRFVTISVDPQRDTPEVLREYASRVGAGPRWSFLTGELEPIYRLCREGFLLTVARQRAESGKVIDETLSSDLPATSQPQHEILHSTMFVLVDHAGVIRGYFDGTDATALAGLERAARVLSRDARVPPALAALPAVNATLNGCAALLLSLGYVAIRARRPRVHRTLTLAAFACSVMFLGSYLTYHAFAGETRIAATGAVRVAYLVLLATHVLLAAAIVPLSLLTLVRALRGELARHRRIARLTLPLWLYVSITGVAIYALLYHAYPPPGLRL